MPPRRTTDQPSTSPAVVLTADQRALLAVLPSCGGMVPAEIAFQAGMDEARVDVVMGELAALGMVRAWSWQKVGSEGGAWGLGPREEGRART